MARTMIEAGVRAILNYAPITLTVPPSVRVQYIDPVVGLQRMTYYLHKGNPRLHRQRVPAGTGATGPQGPA